MYKVRYSVGGQFLLQAMYGDWKELCEGIDRVKSLYRYKGEVYDAITEIP